MSGLYRYSRHIRRFGFIALTDNKQLDGNPHFCTYTMYFSNNFRGWCSSHLVCRFNFELHISTRNLILSRFTLPNPIRIQIDKSNWSCSLLNETAPGVYILRHRPLNGFWRDFSNCTVARVLMQLVNYFIDFV